MARLLTVWVPDWPVVAASAAGGIPLDAPAAVVHANRVFACSGTARKHGVRRGMRRREAQSICPEIRALPNDQDRDARMFEAVAAEVERLAPGIEVVRPGMVTIPARGPSTAFGGEARAAERMVEHVGTELGLECISGIADGLFASAIAAMRGELVPHGGSAEFLAPLPIADLATPLRPPHPRLDRSRANFIDLLYRLGIRTIGEFAALPERDVGARFGTDAIRLHRIATGRQQRPAVRRAVPASLVSSQEFDPALDRIDTVAFAARGLAERFNSLLTAHGLGCVRLGVRASTANGEEFARSWRCAEPLTEHGIAERVRWQLEGWLRRRDGAPTAGVCAVYLEPEETLSRKDGQLGMWHGAEADRANEERAGRALVRLQGLLGPDSVYTPVLRGARAPGARVRLVPWGEDRVPDTDPDLPWPGRVPAPSPATIPVEQLPVTVLDGWADPVGISARHELTAEPCSLVVDGAERFISRWAGPWLLDEHWWRADPVRELARIQVVCADQRSEQGFLLLRKEKRWILEGVYD
ncbi:DNA polymerase Y family protein [Sciscionella marina]|uniref:DNA polymerase Y family protein n=1 Tax=Sciscionella marina TaxID=508770 RepID=UPI00036A0976|nr:DNA polymerase Y family protein [Sciscionella marina]